VQQVMKTRSKGPEVNVGRRSEMGVKGTSKKDIANSALRGEKREKRRAVNMKRGEGFGPSGGVGRKWRRRKRASGKRLFWTSGSLGSGSFDKKQNK